MGWKHGYIVQEDTPGGKDGGANIRRFKLSNGDHLYLSRDWATLMMTRHSPAEEFFFLEKGLLGKTAWIGTMQDVRLALSGGFLSSDDIKGLKVPVQSALAGWYPMGEEDDHAFVGSKLPQLAERLGQTHPETASLMTRDAWLEDVGGAGGCLAVGSDPNHGSIWCAIAKEHQGDHRGVCPDCTLVKEMMRMVYETAGQWGR